MRHLVGLPRSLGADNNSTLFAALHKLKAELPF
jgi:hypothetical protein